MKMTVSCLETVTGQLPGGAKKHHTKVCVGDCCSRQDSNGANLHGTTTTAAAATITTAVTIVFRSMTPYTLVELPAL